MKTSDLLQKVNLPENTMGSWAVKKFTISEADASFHRLRCAMNGNNRGVTAGTYTKLQHENSSSPMMSDTPAEMRDHWEPVNEAKDWCLIAGLGLGMVAEAMLRKTEVFKVTVIEISEDIIELVAPTLEERWGDRIEIIHADIFEWKPPKGQRYGACWFDIWPNICEDNLPEMATLHRKYGKRTDWQGSWAQHECRRW